MINSAITELSAVRNRQPTLPVPEGANPYHESCLVFFTLNHGDGSSQNDFILHPDSPYICVIVIILIIIP